jgi:hypothetical protein
MLAGAENLLSQGSDLRYREECETEPVPQFFSISIYLAYIMGGGCFALSKEGKQLLWKVFLVPCLRFSSTHRAAQNSCR